MKENEFAITEYKWTEYARGFNILKGTQIIWMLKFHDICLFVCLSKEKVPKIIINFQHKTTRQAVVWKTKAGE